MAFTKELLLEKGHFIIKEAEKLGATQAEVAIELRTEALTRLANSIIDQNIAEKHAKFRITLYYGKQKGSVTVEVFDSNSIEKSVLDASKIAKASGKNEDFKSIPEPQPYSTRIRPDALVCKATLEATPEQRAENAKLAIDTAHDVDKTIKSVAGAISNATVEKAMINSLGIEAYQASTQSRLTLTIIAKKGEEEAAGWSADFQRDFSELRVQNVSEKAARKAADGFGMKIIEPGDYEVVLEPAAVAGLQFYLAFYGFSALFHHDHRTFLKDKIGEKVFSEKLDLWSDPLDERHVLAAIFDDEGVPTQKLDLIKKGVVTNIAYDTLTAGKDGVESTGHNYYSRLFRRSIPLTDHIFICEGDSSLEEMIADTRNGILITHFHYQNLVNAGKGVCTGLTRDGAWLIQNGEIKYPVKTLRYTDSITRFFKDIDLVGRYQDLNDTSSIMMSAIVPPMKLPSFVFTGSSEK